MNSIDLIKEFFGWCSVINIAMLFVSTLMIMVLRGFIVKIHAYLTGVSEEDLPRIYLEFLGNYKILIIMFNVVPYVALSIMA